VYLASNDPHVAGASRYGQHLQRVVTLQYLCFVVVTVYVPLISTTVRLHVYYWHRSLSSTRFLISITAVLDIDISIYYDSSRDGLLHLVRIHG